MFQTIHNLVLKRLRINTLSSLACVSGVTALDDKALDAAVEDSVVVLATRGQGQEVLCCFGAQLAVELDFYVAVGCYQRDGHLDFSIRVGSLLYKFLSSGLL